MEAQSFYDTYHMSLMQSGPPATPATSDISNFVSTQPIWPKDIGGAFSVPNTTPNIFPMPVPRGDIINSTSHPSEPATIYSGVEPLASLDNIGLKQHFQDTSMPWVAGMIRPNAQPLEQTVSAPHMEYSKQQTELLHKMASSMNHHHR